MPISPPGESKRWRGLAPHRSDGRRCSICLREIGLCSRGRDGIVREQWLDFCLAGPDKGRLVGEDRGRTGPRPPSRADGPKRRRDDFKDFICAKNHRKLEPQNAGSSTTGKVDRRRSQSAVGRHLGRRRSTRPAISTSKPLPATRGERNTASRMQLDLLRRSYTFRPGAGLGSYDGGPTQSCVCGLNRWHM